MFIRTKNDINYFKFLEFTARIVDPDDQRHVLEETYLVFKPKNLNKFARAIERDGRLKKRFRLDLDFDKTGGAGRFIDADTFFRDENYLELFKILLKPRRRFLFWRYNVKKNLSLREGFFYMELWRDYLAEIKEKYDYIYNPPIRITEARETTQGDYERQAFAEEYGGYMEITYLLTKGRALDEERVWSWGVNRFLFRGEYALKKRDVENLK